MDSNTLPVAGRKVESASEAGVRPRERKGTVTTPQRNRVGKKDDGGGIVKELADAICADNHFAQDAGDKLFVFKEGVFQPRGEKLVRLHVKQLCERWTCTEEWSPKLANDVVEFIRVDAPVLWERPPLDLINVRNGLLRIADRILLPHTPDHLSAIQLPVNYDPAAKCPEIEKYCAEWFPLDAISLAWEIPAYLMRPDTGIQKAVLLIGPGGNGKSRWLALLLAFLGRNNTAGVSLHQLEADKFKAARLLGKLANVCADLPSEHLAGTSVFKALTGGDPITGEHKFKDSFDFVPFARLIFSANNPPRSQDSSQGFFDRWLVIPFERSFRGTAEEISSDVLDAKLAAPGELSGLLNKALDALERLKANRGFSQPESVQDAWRDFVGTTDPLAVWLDRYTIDDPSLFVVKRELRAAFNANLERHGKPALTDKAFGLALTKHKPRVESRQKTVNGKVEWVYLGIGLSTAEPSQGSQHSQHSPSLYQSHANAYDLWEQRRENTMNAVNAVNEPDVNSINRKLAEAAEQEL